MMHYLGENATDMEGDCQNLPKRNNQNQRHKKTILQISNVSIQIDSMISFIPYSVVNWDLN